METVSRFPELRAFRPCKALANVVAPFHIIFIWVYTGKFLMEDVSSCDTSPLNLPILLPDQEAEVVPTGRLQREGRTRVQLRQLAAGKDRETNGVQLWRSGEAYFVSFC